VSIKRNADAHGQAGFRQEVYNMSYAKLYAYANGPRSYGQSNIPVLLYMKLRTQIGELASKAPP
jgi:hypothetical protein